ncbi:hypothetical protein BGW37DRAFT_417265 [Umbelopsis sp. PMI_123]|nr:hypothetical protein BGW37DRAFT_417265 [Umbelopsis sp. PMI_123]
MFSWKKTAKEPQTGGKNVNTKSIDNMDFSDLLNDPVHSFDGEDNLDEMDPDLLRQLQELSAPSTPRKPKAKPKPNPSVDQSDIDSYARLAQDEEIEVDFDENDMNDPNLLVKQPVLEGQELIDTCSSVVESSGMNFEHNNITSMQPMEPIAWNTARDEYQKAAIAAKRTGNKTSAIDLLRKSKAFTARTEELKELQSDDSPFTDDQIQEPSEPARKPSPKQPERSPERSTSYETEHPKRNNSSEIQKLLETLVTRQKEYKQAALHYKDIGNLVVAKEMIRVSKEVLQTAVSVKNGQLTAPKVIRSKIPQPPDMDLGSGKPRHVQEVDLIPSTGNLPNFAQLEKTLSYQVDICHNLELQNIGKAGGNFKLGDSFKALAKTFAADMVSLKSAENTNAALPRFHYQNVTYVYGETNPNIGSNEMIINIKNATKLQTLETAAQDIEAYVQWDLGGWPPENVPQAHLGKGQLFDFKTSVPITRHNRAFMRYLQRKKATFEIYHKRYSYGLFARPLLLGKVNVEMNHLLNHATVGGMLELLDLNKKKTGAMVHVEISLSEPLSETDIPTKQEKWLIIDEFNSNIYPLLASAQLIPHQPTIATEDKLAKPATDQATANNTSHEVVIPPKVAATEEESEFEKAEAEFNDADSIVSNMVLENEIGLVNSAIAACQGTVPDNLIDQKQALEIKMNMLVIQVQSGGLTIEQYLNNVKSRIEQDKKCALIFKRAGRLDLAKQALRRKKIAQDEVDEAEAAMAQQAEEDNDS